VILNSRDHFINHIGRRDDPIAVAKASTISAKIWRDYQQGIIDTSLLSYQYKSSFAIAMHHAGMMMAT
jgi:hypothetical protein